MYYHLLKYGGVVYKGAGSCNNGLEDDVVDEQHYHKGKSHLYSVLSVLGKEQHYNAKYDPDDAFFSKIGEENHYVVEYRVADVSS